MSAPTLSSPPEETDRPALRRLGLQRVLIGRHRLRRAAAAVAFLVLASCSSDTPATLNRVNTHELFNEAYRQISDYYIEPTTPERLGLAGLGKLTGLDSSITVERQGDQIVLAKSGAVLARFEAPSSTDSWDWGGVTASALDVARHASPKIAATSEDELDKIVMDGAIATLDKFSRYATPTAAREQRAERNGFDGIGVTLEPDETQVRVLTVLPDGPAEHAGIKANDRIVTIDGTVASTLTRDQVVMRLRGPSGTRVVIGIERSGTPEPITVSVNRAHIVLPTVTMKLDGRIAIFRITSFNLETYEQLIEALAKARHELGAPPAGIVLDLRDNPGGLLDQSVKVASVFLHGGLVVSTVGRRRESRREYPVESSRAIDSIPLVVLMNGGSASASEIVASALQDRGRAVVIGTSSFGKGTVQTVLELLNDGELTVTWAKLVTPEGYVLHEHGVVPTLCTADLGEDDGAVARAIQQGSGTGTGLAARPRIALDEKGWTELRSSCPAQRVDRAVDLKLAERLLQDPVLYTRVLNAMPIESARTAAAAR